ncbi:MAG: 5-deoxy-glucuronate isomerase [Acidobacteriota bacterium]|nr:5-deoxy-glucuronate isomerase [Acidobacteriota bacterium]
MADNHDGVIFHSIVLPKGQPGTLVSLTREQAGWETVNFAVRRLAACQTLQGNTRGDEAAFILLSGRVSADWGEGWKLVGERKGVFSNYPSAVYIPRETAFELRADVSSEIADCRAPCAARLKPRLISHSDIRLEIRGGGNATRQILDVIPASFPAERLLICEVFTPGGNWSSYPPHKHDVHNPPYEADLDEVYYYRTRDPMAYAFQRLYNADGTRDEILKASDGDVVVVRDGYHPVVAAYGYDVYYLNVLAGSEHSFANSDDPHYAHLRRHWPPPDPRLPLVRPVS